MNWSKWQFATVFAVAVTLSVSASAVDWMTWRGPGDDGIVSSVQWVPKAIENEENIIWKKNVGKGYSAACVKGDRLYTVGNEKNTDNIYCLDANTGEEIWTYSFPCAQGSYPGPRTTPVWDDGLIYTLSREGHLNCLDAKTGKVRWQKNITTEFGAQLPTWGHASSAVIEGDMLLLNACTHGLALNKKTGDKIWASPPGPCTYASPVVHEIGGAKQVLVFAQNGLIGVDLKTGRKLWSFPWKTAHDVHAADPIASGNFVFISSGYNTGGAMIDLSGQQPRELWRNKVMCNHFSTSILLGGHLYGISGNAGGGKLVCMNPRTGEKVWDADTGFGNLIAINDNIVVLNERGELHVVKAKPEGAQTVAKGSSTLSKTCWTAPVFANQKIYCRNDRGDMVCIDVSK